MRRRVVTVFGGSGFIGRHLVRRLANAGAIVRVAVRDTESAMLLKPMGDPGQIVAVRTDITDRAQVDAALKGADAAVNLVGILAEWGRKTFQRFHVEGAKNVAEAAKAAGVANLVHVSALGADEGSAAKYAKTKAEAEKAVLAAFPEATVLRPSVVFGPEDGFFNKFGVMATLLPVLPVFGCPVIPKVTLGGEDMVEVDLYGDGGTKFQPVFVGDVAEAIVKAMETPEAAGKTYELGGPKVMSFKDVMDLILKETQRKAFLAPIPFFVAKIQAFFFGLYPDPVLTGDQVKLLESDNVVSGDAPGLADLGIEATAAETVVPTYLHRYRKQKDQRVRLATHEG